jgi:hypothetical protein
MVDLFEQRHAALLRRDLLEQIANPPLLLPLGGRLEAIDRFPTAIPTASALARKVPRAIASSPRVIRSDGACVT